MKQSICHPQRKNYCKGLCRACYEKQLRESNLVYAEKQRENSRRWTEKNRERKREIDRLRYINNPESPDKRFTRYLKYKFNISKEDYDLVLEKQNNKCAICGRGPAMNGKKLHLDHCHRTNKIRGLLCAQCNWYLGFIEKDYNIIQNILDYLNINVNGSSKEVR